MNRSLAARLALASLLCAGLAGPAAVASPVVDATGDFLETYTGSKDADLDVRFADVVIDPKAGTVRVAATLAGPIDGASNKLYVFGIDRGRGEAGRDLVFQGPLGGEPKIGRSVRWDAAIGLTATGHAVFFDALNPGIVPLPDVAVRIAGSEISATVPLSLLPSQGFALKDYTFNFWPRSEISLANIVLSDFAPDHGDAPVGIVGRRAAFNLVRSARAETSGCLAGASAVVRIHSVGEVDEMEVSLQGLPPDSDFDLFVVQQPNAPFGVAWYQGDLRTDKHGRANQRFIGRFNEETFLVAPGSVAAPSIHHDAFPDAQMNTVSGPVHAFHLGVWFDTPAAAAKAGCPGDTTPFNGTHNAGIQALSTRNFPDLEGPLSSVRP